jgi:hypothetical protein
VALKQVRQFRHLLGFCVCTQLAAWVRNEFSPGQRASSGGSIAADLRSQQRTKRNRPGTAVIAGHGVGHGTTTKAAD